MFEHQMKHLHINTPGIEKYNLLFPDQGMAEMFFLWHVRHLHTVTHNFSIKTWFSSSQFLGQHWMAILDVLSVSERVSDSRPDSMYSYSL